MLGPADRGRDSLVPDWPADFVHRYVTAGFWREGTFADALTAIAERLGDDTAVIDGGRRITYGELDRSATAIASGLASLGLRKGDTVVVQLPNCAEFIELAFALFRLGVVPIFALPAHRALEVEAFCTFGEAKAYIIAKEHDGFDYCGLAAHLKNNVPCLKHVIVLGAHGSFSSFDDLRHAPPIAMPPVQAVDLACFQLSGGSTGIPKLIPRRHRDYLYNVRASITACDFHERTAYMAALPMGHNFPMACPGFLGALLAGGRVVVARRPTPEVCFELIRKERVTVTALVPPLAMIWLDAAVPGALPSLRTLQVGGAKLNYEAARRIEPVLGCKLQQVFGMAEGLICYTGLDDSDDVVLHTQGRPMSPGDEIRVVDDGGREVADGEVGHLLTRGPYTIRGYYRAPVQNAEAFTAEGFYRSGDLVRRVGDGYLVVEGRDKDQINRGGEKVTAEEVENCLLGHDAIRDAIVVAMPDAYLGERVCAFIVARDTPLKSVEVRRFLRQRGLAEFKIPDQYRFLDAFPTTGVGKVSRKQLREQLQATHFPKSSVAG